MRGPSTVAHVFPPCPECESRDAVAIAWGYPSAETWEAERGEVVIGGCLVGPESPAYECRDCHVPLQWLPRD